MNFPEKYLVYDIRTSKNFKNATISGYKKKDVIKAFQNSLINNNINDSIKWEVELNISCYDKEIWKSIFEIYFKHIHFNNPKLYIYLLKRKKEYNNVLIYYPKNHYIFSRNNLEIRNLLCEISCLITISKKTNLFLDKSLPKININNLTIHEIKKRILTKNFKLIENFTYDDTPSIIKICINEIYFNLENGTLNNCFYWYILLTKLKKENLNLFSKQENENKSILNYFIDDNLETSFEFKHYIYILWNILDLLKLKLNKNNQILFEKLKEYYFENFKINQINSKKYIIFFIFYIIKNTINWNINLITNESIYIQSNININNMYYKILNNIYKELNNDQKKLYLKKYYKTLNNYLEVKNNLNNSNKIYKESLNENLNIILHTNNDFVSKKSKKNYNKTYSDPNLLINKNKTIQDVLDAKEEKKNKKIQFISTFYVPRIKEKKNKNIMNFYNFTNFSKNDNIKSIHIKKK